MAAEVGYARQVAPQPAAPMPTPSAEGFGAGIGDALQQTAQVAHREGLQAYQIQREQSRDEQWTGFLKAYGDHQLAMADAAREGRKTAGAGYTAEAAKAWDDSAGKLLDGLTEDNVRRNAQRMLDEGRTRFVIGEGDYEETARVGKTLTDFGQQLDTAANLSRRLDKPDDYTAQVAQQQQAVDGLDLPDLQKDKLHREVQTTLGVSYLQGRIAVDPALAKALMGSGAFDDVLTSTQLEALSRSADVEIHSREVAAHTQAALAKSAVSDDVSVAIAQIGKGTEWKDTDVAALRQRAVAAGIGEARLYELDDAAAKNTVNREFRKAGPEAIGAEVDRINAQLAGQAKDDPALVSRRNHLVELQKERRADIASDQVGWAAQNGLPVAPFVDSNPAPQQVQGRVVAVDAAAKSAGVEPKYLTEDEQKRFAGQAAAGQAGALEVLQFARRFGPQRAFAVMRQIRPNDEALAWLTALPDDAAHLALTGQEAIRGNPKILSYNKTDKPDLAESSDVQDKQFAAATVGMDERQRQAIRGTFGHLLAGMVSQGNELTPALRWKALNLALGATGTPDHGGKGGLALWSADNPTSTYVVPNNLTKAQFAGRVQAAWKASPPVNPDGSPASLAAAAPRRVGPARYTFVSKSGSLFRHKDGSPFVVDLSGNGSGK